MFWNNLGSDFALTSVVGLSQHEARGGADRKQLRKCSVLGERGIVDQNVFAGGLKGKGLRKPRPLFLQSNAALVATDILCVQE